MTKKRNKQCDKGLKTFPIVSFLSYAYWIHLYQLKGLTFLVIANAIFFHRIDVLRFLTMLAIKSGIKCITKKLWKKKCSMKIYDLTIICTHLRYYLVQTLDSPSTCPFHCHKDLNCHCDLHVGFYSFFDLLFWSSNIQLTKWRRGQDQKVT